MSRTLAVVTASVLLFLPCAAGVVVELEVEDLTEGDAISLEKVYAQAGKLRMQPGGNGEGSEGTIIFDGEAILILNGADKSYFRMDSATISSISKQVDSMMEQVTAALADLPPEEREMAEKMMKQQGMPGLPTGDEAAEPVRRLDEQGKLTIGDYECTMYHVFVDDEKVSEICAAGMGQLAAAEEAFVAFRGLARFADELLETMKQGPLAAALTDNPFQLVEELNGFPILVRQFDSGKPIIEVRYRSATRETLSDELFRPPPDYRHVDPLGALGPN